VSEALGALRADGDRLALRFERRYDATPAEVWAALTEPESIRRWLFADAVLEPRVGGAFRLSWSEGESAAGSVLAWDPPRALEVEWAWTGMRSVLRIDLSPAEDGTALVLDHRDVTTQAAVSMGAGWHAHLDALGGLLAGQAHAGEAWQRRYESLRPRYAGLVAGG
jgi:uncharacterized protein YndB with AHSA1/START domain